MGTPRKAHLINKHQDRTVNVYPISDIEIESVLSNQNSSSFYSSFASAMPAIFLATFIPILTSDSSGLGVKVISYLEAACVVSLLLSIVSFIKFYFGLSKTKKLFTKIKNGS